MEDVRAGKNYITINISAHLSITPRQSASLRIHKILHIVQERKQRTFGRDCKPSCWRMPVTSSPSEMCVLKHSLLNVMKANH